MAERDYVLGTHDDEIYRLGYQHRVWRPRALDAWARAHIGDGCKVIDFGAGPGFATMDLAEMVPRLQDSHWVLSSCFPFSTFHSPLSPLSPKLFRRRQRSLQRKKRLSSSRLPKKRIARSSPLPSWMHI